MCPSTAHSSTSQHSDIRTCALKWSMLNAPALSSLYASSLTIVYATVRGTWSWMY